MIKKYYDIEDIKDANKEAGHHFFSRGAMRFFDSRVCSTVYHGVGGIYFVTSEKFDHITPRMYTVRVFNPNNGHVDSISEFNELSYKAAHNLAAKLAKGE